MEVLEERIAGLQREIAAAAHAQLLATVKAELALERRLESVNEFRAQLTSQAATFATREQTEALDAKFRALYETNRAEIVRLSRLDEERRGEQAGSRHTIAAIFASLAACVAILSIVVIVTNLLLSG